MTDFLKVGAVVKIQHWHGEIVDLARSENGRIMLLVKSPKGIWRNHPAEWLEYQEGQIQEADLKEAIQSFDFFIQQVEKMLEALKTMRRVWANKIQV